MMSVIGIATITYSRTFCDNVSRRTTRDGTKTINTRASQWYEAQDMLDEAIEYAFLPG